MYIEKLEIKNFRNYEEAGIAFDPGTNIFYGDNAQGKTNLLEAIRLCGTTRSHRGSADSEMIRFEQKDAHLRLAFCRGGMHRRIDMHLRRGGAKGAAVDGVPIRRASELMGMLHTVLFSPEDLAIVKSGPRERRRFIDSELCQLSGAYFSELSAYNKVVLQRNALLKEIAFRPSLADTLDVWDEQLAAHGRPLIRARKEFIGELGGMAGKRHAQLTGNVEKLTLAYEADADEDSLEDRIRKNREKDLHLRTTGSGPHRDDMRVQVNGLDIRKYGSQGQQRSAALSLKLAEIEMVEKRIGEPPVLLLDDVLSELDGSRQALLLEGIAGVQTFITCTGMEEMIENRFPMDRIFHVESGRIRS